MSAANVQARISMSPMPNAEHAYANAAASVTVFNSWMRTLPMHMNRYHMYTDI